jgi:hypothetical protein
MSQASADRHIRGEVGFWFFFVKILIFVPNLNGLSNISKELENNMKLSIENMKVSINKCSIFYTLALMTLFVSCNEVKMADANIKKPVENMGELYYYKNYHCFDFVKRCELEILKLKNLDTLIYVNTSQFHGTYDEIHGKLTKINDTIYHVTPFKYLHQGGNRAKPFHTEKGFVFFYCDSSLINSTLKIEYLNGQISQYNIYATMNKFRINETYFNKYDDRIYVSFNHKNPIIDENIEIVSKYDTPKYNIVFESVRKPEDFYIILKNDRIISLHSAISNAHNLGIEFNMERMPQGFILPKGRKLYK